MARKISCLIRVFASLIGCLISVCPAVQYGLLYIKESETAKFLSLTEKNEDYSAIMKIFSRLQEIFRWWISIFPDSEQSNKIRSGRFIREIFSDTSLNSWGASWRKSRTHGWWSNSDRTLHINALELKAVFDVLHQTFMTATSYFGLTILRPWHTLTNLAQLAIQFPLSDISRQIWRWCKERNIFVFASYIQSVDNVIADAEYRITDLNME